MDKNTITGFILIALVFIGFSYFSQPSPEEIALQQRQDSIAVVNARKAEAEQKAKDTKQAAEAAATAADTTTLFGKSKTGTARDIQLKNELVSITISTKGGTPTAVELTEYNDQEGKPVQLFNDKTAALNYTLALKAENINTRDHYFNVEESTDSTAMLSLEAPDGSKLTLSYKLPAGEYMANCIVTGMGMEKYFAPNQHYMLIDWRDQAKQQEKGYDFEARYSTLTYKLIDENTPDYLNETKEDEEKPEKALDWIAFKNQFFSCVMISHQNFTNTTLKSTPMEKGTGFLKKYEATTQTAFDPTGTQPTQLQFYFGPNQYRLLQKTNNLSLSNKDLNLEHLVYLGWPFIRLINRYFTIYLFDWLTNLGISMGIVLLLITILLKILVYPTTKKSYMSSAKMRVLKPKLDEIQKKYPNKEDAMQMQQEIMTTYSKYGVSPMGGCLPILLQTPIWIAMFNFVPVAIELRGEKFLWSDDLSTYDSLITFNQNLPLIGDHISLFCILFCASNLLYSWINLKMQKDSMAATGQAAQQMKMMQWMMMLMPLFFFFVFNNYSAGLNYYYWISLMFSAIIMWFLRWRTDDAKLLAQLEKNYEKNTNNPQKMKGLAARLEAMQKQQQAMQQRKNK